MPRHFLVPLDRLAAETSAASLGGAATFLLLCVFALVACASHGRRWYRAVRRRDYSEPVMCIHQVQPGAGETEACIWQRSILMGEKCELPDFSGMVTYDSAGNLVVPGRPRAALLALALK